MLLGDGSRWTFALGKLSVGTPNVTTRPRKPETIWLALQIMSGWGSPPLGLPADISQLIFPPHEQPRLVQTGVPQPTWTKSSTSPRRIRSPTTASPVPHLRSWSRYPRPVWSPPAWPPWSAVSSSLG